MLLVQLTVLDVIAAIFWFLEILCKNIKNSSYPSTLKCGKLLGVTGMCHEVSTSDMPSN